MPLIERFIHQHTGREFNQFGEIVHTDVSYDVVLSTRPFLTRDRLNGKERRHGNETPDIIFVNNYFFCVDGHHKIRRGLGEGQRSGLCRVLATSDSQIFDKLTRMNHGYITDLPIK